MDNMKMMTDFAKYVHIDVRNVPLKLFLSYFEAIFRNVHDFDQVTDRDGNDDEEKSYY